MKRRVFIPLGIGGLAAAVGGGYSPARDRASLLIKKGACSSLSSGSGNVPFRFAAAGDVGTGHSGQRRVARAITTRWCADPFQTVLLLGDNIYEDGDISRIEEVFEQPYAELLQRNIKFYATLGNHDFRTRQGEDEIAYPGYNMSGRYYTFSQQSVQFFALDTNQFYINHDKNRETLWSAQRQWLKTELKRSQAPWKVVFAHHPIYSSGYHGSDRNLAKDLSPLFKEYGVQLYLNGHDHHYERTQPIDGITYITAGNGGRDIRRVGQSSWTAYANARLGFATFDVYDDQIVVKAIGTDESVFDEASIPSTVATAHL